jgi:hypothetical protein
MVLAAIAPAFQWLLPLNSNHCGGSLAAWLQSQRERGCPFVAADQDHKNILKK